ncbi:exodeoxyribonuclease VII large subunit [Methylobacterium gnaphalii]|uniref:Exodeoxyribonuclease 7 large subunit n=3 Tax=Methylobacterium gnaphalii TaxID=1010610 RepID=A0A512JPK0_9HYPH|nr:exodeoxyribonuclease VII large subunit [Methylobacterium gnaphalii]GEP11862.1 exodeoxyribonuclease 7 large subunit [Methylobacterium gnaphalii]GJD71495.1 Exodeoxyribonuclease 7 large subunit [Methylobacterium gnaphalii]
MPLVPPPQARHPLDAETPPSSHLQSNAPEWSVGDLASALKRTLEDAFGHVRLRGEISGYRGPHGSGHAYFSLKDGTAKIDAVVWKGVLGRLRQKPKEGLEVLVTGKITTFAGKSSYQIVVDSMEPAGIGAWMALLEERKRLLAAEGLFAPERKRAIPYLPRVIGIVTSPTGAVIRDILHRLQDRFPRPVVVWPVRVQGEGAADEIAAAIRGFNALHPRGNIPRPDVLIVARGGGSIEDLWAFNEEAVVRAAAGSAIPLISAVGHETDTTLIDFVADRRAPTPTGAAEMAVPVRADLLDEIHDLGARQRGTILRRVERERLDLRALVRAMPDPDSFLAAKRQRLDLAEARLAPALAANARDHRERLTRLTDRLARRSPAVALADARGRLARIDDRPRTALHRMIERRRDRLDALGGLLGALSYRGVLARGYALVREEDGSPVRSASLAGLAPRLQLQFADGAVMARPETAEEDDTPSLRKRSPGGTKVRPAKPSTAKQGSLF